MGRLLVVVDAYFVRCTRDGGAVEWFRLADDERSPAPRSADARVLALRHASDRVPAPRVRRVVVIAKVTRRPPHARRQRASRRSRRSPSGE